MSKLKTLKNLTHLFCATDFGFQEGDTTIEVSEPYVTGECVRKIFKCEAIKWINEFERRKNSNYVDDFGSYHDFDNIMDYQNVINWIKFFFNIIEEDLKI